ncbi:MAG: Wzz/FepE/Etk N-terminal domain-containing protein [Methyloceanibacter sp.]
MLSQQGLPLAEDVDLGALGRALWRAKTWIVGLAAGAGIMTFVGLSMVRPLNTSESRILIENDVSPFTRTATDPGHDQKQALDEQAVQIQVQVLTSRDLALDVVKALDLAPALRQRKNGHRSPKPRRSISLWRHRRP